jgi:hypothetical protein
VPESSIILYLLVSSAACDTKQQVLHDAHRLVSQQQVGLGAPLLRPPARSWFVTQQGPENFLTAATSIAVCLQVEKVEADRTRTHERTAIKVVAVNKVIWILCFPPRILKCH